ncbi:MAG TPA: hypothetical protein VF255_02495 [Solirubrobacterales bacterium]
MRPRPIASLALLALVALSGCGDDGTATAHKESATTASTSTRQASPRCAAQLGGFVEALDSLRRQLAVGLTYAEYLDEVQRLRRVYRDVPVERLGVGCLVAAGTPSEQAFNRYIDAVNAWGDCLATAGCETESVEPELQRGWELASKRLSAAQAGLRG